MRTRCALVAIGVAVVASAVVTEQARAWSVVSRDRLEVTSGTITRSLAAPRLDVGTNLRTSSAVMRAGELDNGLHARQARLRFRFNGPSTTTVPLGSGLVVRQIGLKLWSSDPCNLVYVMWRSRPDRAIVISVKRNPGQTTSAQCGNRGYTPLATIPTPRDAGTGGSTRELRVTTSPLGSSLRMRVFRDGTQVYVRTLRASLVDGLNGPVGVRSDNGDYTFQLAVQARHP